MRNFLVTGGAGFIGSHIAEALVSRGDRVRVLDNLSTGRLSNLAPFRDRIELIEADLNDEVALARAVAGVDCVFHEAALASVPRSVERPLETNAACVTGTLALLNAASKAGVRRVVYAGSSSAYGDQPSSSKRETDLPLPISPYGAAKIAAELYCHAFAAMKKIETVTLRYFNVFGPRQDPTSEYSAVIPKFITLLLSGKRPTVFGDGLQSRDFTFVGDVVNGNLLAAEAPDVSGRVLNLAGGRSITLLQMLDLLSQLLNKPANPIFEPPRPGDVRESLADITLARRLLNFEAKVSFEEGLRRSIDYYKSEYHKAAK
jgi:UDP-glucose 4-epimerase